MLGKVAVLICGEYRTWDLANQYIFNFVESVTDNADYYFVSWNTTTDYWKNASIRQTTQRSVDSNAIEKSFDTKNLIEYQLLDAGRVTARDSYYLRAHLSKVANILKRQQELTHNFIYDQVIEIRPDVFIPKVTKTLKPCHDFEYVIGETFSHYRDLPSIPDLYFRTSSAGNDILASRGANDLFEIFKKFDNLLVRDIDYEPLPLSRDHHYLLLNFLMNKRMIPLKDQSEAAVATVVRPNFPKSLDNLSLNEIKELYNAYAKSVDNL